MRIVKGFLYKYKKILILFFLIIISFVFMFTSSSSAVLNFKKIGLSIIFPFQYVFHATGSFFVNTFNSISELKKSRQEINRLRNELKQYKQIIIDFNELKNEITNLNNLLELKNEIENELSIDSIACEVVGRNPENLFDVLIINKGSKDGIKDNMPVIGYAGGKKILVGKVVEATLFASKVITIQNPSFSVGSIIAKDRSHTIVQGSKKNPGIVKLLYVPKNYNISAEELNFVYTSGDSLLFPGGIEIGKIVKIYPSKKYENFNEADVQISIDLSKIDYVIVLKIDTNKEIIKFIEGLSN